MTPPFMFGIDKDGEFMLLAIKYMFVIAGFIYLLFAYLITKQIKMMNKTLSTTISTQNRLLGRVHMIVSILVLIYFLLVL
jgi:hypothetical protein